MTYQIIYSSEAATPMQTDELEDLLEQARISNAENGITGALVYADGIFLQILEGDQGALQALMARICRDLRHEGVTVVRQGEIAAAMFTDWNMAYVSATAEQVALWAGFSQTTEMPRVLADIRQDPQQAAMVARSILACLVPETDAPTQPD